MEEARGMEDVIKTAEYAYLRVPLYMELGEKYQLTPNTFDALPIVGKDYYVKAAAPALSCDYVADLLERRLLRGRTSGSTGKYTDFFWSPVEERHSLFELWFYRRKYYGISPEDKMVYFFPIVQEEEEIIETGSVLGLSKAFLYNQRLRQAYELIQVYRPKWMILQPSVAWMLCDLMKKSHLEEITSVTYIEFTGEYLDDKIRRETEAVFGCRTANQYGLREVNSIAYECPQGHMHVMRNNAYVEIIHKGENEVGDICITSLQNHAMPYIRYNTGDKGRLMQMDCPCGNPHPVLEIHKGRDNDWIRINPEEKMHPYFFMQMVSEANMFSENQIIQFQVIQKAYDLFAINLVVDKEYQRQKTEALITKMVRGRFGKKIQIRFHYFDTLLPDMMTGKIAVFVSELKET